MCLLGGVLCVCVNVYIGVDLCVFICTYIETRVCVCVVYVCIRMHLCRYVCLCVWRGGGGGKVCMCVGVCSLHLSENGGPVPPPTTSVTHLKHIPLTPLTPLNTLNTDLR